MCIFVSVCWCGEQVSKIHWPVVSVVHDPFAGDDDEDTDYDAAVVGGGHVHGEDDEDEDEDDEEDDHLAHASADTSSVGVSVLERPFPLSNVSPPPFQKNRMFFCANACPTTRYPWATACTVVSIFFPWHYMTLLQCKPWGHWRFRSCFNNFFLFFPDSRLEDWAFWLALPSPAQKRCVPRLGCYYWSCSISVLSNSCKFIAKPWRVLFRNMVWMLSSPGEPKYCINMFFFAAQRASMHVTSTVFCIARPTRAKEIRRCRTMTDW